MLLAENLRLNIFYKINGVIFQYYFSDYSNSHYDIHLAGPWGLFLKATKSFLIPLNGRLVLKFYLSTAP